MQAHTTDPRERLLAGLDALDQDRPIRPSRLAAVAGGIVTKETVRRAISAGELPAIRITTRGDAYVWPDDGRRWLAERMRAARA